MRLKSKALRSVAVSLLEKMSYLYAYGPAWELIEQIQSSEWSQYRKFIFYKKKKIGLNCTFRLYAVCMKIHRIQSTSFVLCKKNQKWFTRLGGYQRKNDTCTVVLYFLRAVEEIQCAEIPGNKCTL